MVFMNIRRHGAPRLSLLLALDRHHIFFLTLFAVRVDYGHFRLSAKVVGHDGQRPVNTISLAP